MAVDLFERSTAPVRTAAAAAPRVPQSTRRVRRAIESGVVGLARRAIGVDARRRPVSGDPPWPQACFHAVGGSAIAEVGEPQVIAGARESGITDLVERVCAGYALTPPGMLELPGGRVHLPSGIVAFDGLLPEEAITLDGFPYGWQLADCLRALWSRAETVPDGFVASLQLSQNYYHWVAEVLPLALLCGDLGGEAADLPIYVADDMPRFVHECLDIVGLSDRVVRLGRGVHRCERMLVPAPPGGAEWPSPADLAAVRAGILECLDPPPPGVRRRLLISRDDAPDRRVRNEDELMRALVRRGVERVSLAGMSVRDQVALFRQAELVIAPHGAGLVNVLFAPEGCAVVEMIGARHVSACFLVVSSSAGHRHGFAICEDRGRDLVADVPAVLRAVDALDG